MADPIALTQPDSLPGDREEQDGLSSSEAAGRLERFGPNELPRPEREGLGRRAIRQLLEPMAILLATAAAVSGFALGKPLDAIAIVTIVAANVVIALIQEGRAANALDALRTMETPTATVVREGRRQTMPSREVVPGDVVVISAGDRVPADLRLVEAVATEIDESMLTGESLPAEKIAGGRPAEANLGLADQHGVAFAGTLVVRGSALGIAIETGARTQLGRIAHRLDGRVQPTPLQRELRHMTLLLGIAAAAIAVAVFGITLLRLGAAGHGFENAFLSAAALAVAAVPEGLPTVVTVALALGVRRMATRGSIVRRLPAVETLGSTTVILTDKTGTLTENRMRVEAVFGPDGALVIDETGLRRAHEVLALCNDATVDPPTGDPMEIAMLEAVGGALVDALREDHPRLQTVPFDPERRRMTTVHAFDNDKVALVKGAVESVLPLCTQPGGSDRAAGTAVHDQAESLAAAGARVLALARGTVQSEVDTGDPENDLTFVGLVALRDAVRPEAAGAVTEARSAGIRVLMVTGDHPGTALAVARAVGLSSGGSAITGEIGRASCRERV